MKANRDERNPCYASAVFCIVDYSINSHGDRYESGGIDTTEWRRKGAPVLWNHHRFIPIGTSINPRTGQLDYLVDEDRVFARVHFNMGDDYAAAVYDNVRRGLIRCASISCDPLAAHKEKGIGNWAHDRTSLKEWSITHRGANRNALVQHKSWAEIEAMKLHKEVENWDDPYRVVDRELSKAAVGQMLKSMTNNMRH